MQIWGVSGSLLDANQHSISTFRERSPAEAKQQINVPLWHPTYPEGSELFGPDSSTNLEEFS